MCHQKPVAPWRTEYCCVVTKILVTCTYMKSQVLIRSAILTEDVYQSTIISTRNMWIYYIKNAARPAFSSILFSSYPIKIRTHHLMRCNLSSWRGFSKWKTVKDMHIKGIKGLEVCERQHTIPNIYFMWAMDSAVSHHTDPGSIYG